MLPSYNYNITVLQIGFIDPSYTTREESAFVMVSVGILGTGVVLDDDFVVTLETMDIFGINNAAQGTTLYSSAYKIHVELMMVLSLFLILVGADYEIFSMDLTFNRLVRRIDLNVTVLDDTIVEQTELFSGQLTVVTIGLHAPNSELNPQTAYVSILDDGDSKLMCDNINKLTICVKVLFFFIRNHCWCNRDSHNCR